MLALWIALVVTVAVGLSVDRYERALKIFMTALMSFVVAMVVNMVVVMVAPKDVVTVPIDGKVVLQTVNDEPTYVFKAGGKNYSFDADVLHIDISNTSPGLRISSYQKVSLFYSVLPSHKFAKEYTLVIKPTS